MRSAVWDALDIAVLWMSPTRETAWLKTVAFEETIVQLKPLELGQEGFEHPEMEPRWSAVRIPEQAYVAAALHFGLRYSERSEPCQK